MLVAPDRVSVASRTGVTQDVDAAAAMNVQQ